MRVGHRLPSGYEDRVTVTLPTDEEISHLRGRLLLRQSELFAAIPGVEADLLWVAQVHQGDYVERGDKEPARRLLQSLAGEDRAEFQALMAALDRIDNDNFGVCTECGAPVEALRLAGVPATPFCEDCAADFEGGAAD